LIITSDHGMANVQEKLLLNLTDVSHKQIFDERLVEQIWFDGPSVLVYAKPKQEILLKGELENVRKNYPTVDWYTNEDIPERWHFAGHKTRSPDILGVLKMGAGWWPVERNNEGNHGYDFENPEMRPIFIGHGPNFRSGFEYNGTVETVDLYPMIANLIGLNLTKAINRSISGQFSRVEPIVIPARSVFYIWIVQYVDQVTMYQWAAIMTLLAVILFCCWYCGGLFKTAFRNKQREKNVYKGQGHYFLSEGLESASEVEDDDDFGKFPRGRKNKSNGDKKTFSIGFGHPSSR